jgi:hypothetical protein
VLLSATVDDGIQSDPRIPGLAAFTFLHGLCILFFR